MSKFVCGTIRIITLSACLIWLGLNNEALSIGDHVLVAASHIAWAFTAYIEGR